MMSRVALGLNVEPGSVDLVTNIRLPDGTYYRLTAFIDTGAEISLFPRRLLNFIEHEVIAERTVDQAGIAGQSFSATEARIKLFFEDATGGETDEIEAIALFADTSIELIGFQDILDRAKLFLDYQETRTGWIEI
jgi:hypothetical protein